MTNFNLDSLSLGNLLSLDEMSSIEAGAFADSASLDVSSFGLTAPVDPIGTISAPGRMDAPGYAIEWIDVA